MAMSPKLELRQGQALVMTPQLQQAIKLLQLSNVELVQFVENELERNPLLERDEDDGEEAPQAASAETADDGSADEGTDDVADLSGQADYDEASEAIDVAEGDLYPDAPTADIGPSLSGLDAGSYAGIGGTAPGGDGDEFDRAAMVVRERTLKEHLAEQLMMTPVGPQERMIAHHLIEQVDEAGYLADDPCAVAERLGIEAEVVEDTLEWLQGFEPAGVFARSLSECLSLQLKENGELTPAMTALLDNLNLVARHDMAALARACGVGREELGGLIVRLRRLNPKPGLAIGGGPAQPVVPDVIVSAASDGSWLVELNSESLPRVLVDQVYYATVARGARNAEEKAYLSECLANASWLVKSLDQRARTVLKVSREIVRQQDAFLIHGVQSLRPLTLRIVADAIEMHESTVSRVTANKYVSTPRGIFELKYFFTSAIAAADGGSAVSAESVRHRIRELIEGESADAVLSDDRLVEILHDAGIDIARRTVAKYRESMNIPSSIQRRRAKRAYA